MLVHIKSATCVYVDIYAVKVRKMYVFMLDKDEGLTTSHIYRKEAPEVERLTERHIPRQKCYIKQLQENEMFSVTV